tara:strand:+ start:252 stop:383 length:132 start_codon:yes stop_codon:yes gene_type:complete
MRIVFIGTVDFSESSLRKLVQIKSKPVGVCTSKAFELAYERQF